MSLKEKAAQIDLSQIGVGQKPAGQQPGKTGPGMHLEAIYRDKKISDENERLRSDLEQFSGALPARHIDSILVHPSRWANRNAKSFLSKEFEQFKEEIESAGGNIQAIKVRPIPCNGPELQSFEIVFGHRRHQACLELGLPVLAVIDEISDLELFEQMDRENRQRADLRPYEQGMMYARALDEGLFPSMRKMTESLCVDQGLASKYVALARLPVEILKAFESPLDLQQRWATELTQALQKNPDLVLAQAKELQKLTPRLPAAKVFKKLVDQGGDVLSITPLPGPVILKGKAGQGAEIIVNFKAKTMVISLKNVDPVRLAEVKKAIQTLIS